MSAGYQNTLSGIANYIDSQLLPTERANLAAWETAARAAGVAEANIIAVLQAWNIWDQATADLSAIAIQKELMRVQAGGPDGIVSQFNPTAPPALPNVPGMLQAQGGALSGAAQYSAPVSPTQVVPAVNIPAAVANDPTAALAGAINNAQITPTESGGPEPWETTVGSQTWTDTPVVMQCDPTRPEIDCYPGGGAGIDFTGGAGESPTRPGLTPPVGTGTDRPNVNTVIDDAPASSGPLSSISGKVVAVVLLVVIGLYLVTKRGAHT